MEINDPALKFQIRLGLVKESDQNLLQAINGWVGKEEEIKED